MRLVAEIEIDTDTIKLWVNPTAGDFGSPDGVSSGDRDLQTITQIVHRAGNGSGQATLANLVVSDDFVSAVPEPGSGILLLASTVALGLRRRR